MENEFDFYRNRQRARQIQGGIRARTSRGVFGTSWWATRWIEVLESFDVGGRLTRGRSYARRGQVISISIEEGLVKAAVQGSSHRPYDIQIRLSPIPFEKWVELSQTSFSQIVVAVKLLAGQMPENVEQLLKQGNVSLFPSKSNDLKTKCSCPDIANPCKHIAAVYYLLAEEFDRDPFLIFKLRGITKDKLLELIVGKTNTPAADAKAKRTKKNPDNSAEESPNKSGKSNKEIGKTKRVLSALETKEEALPSEPDQFWQTKSSPDIAVGSLELPMMNASLLLRLGPLPFWRGQEDLLAALTPVYKDAALKSLDNVARYIK
jgi:uncharacterized Zn finger protein